MPTPMALERENEVLELVCERLSGSGRVISIAGRPDREPQQGRELDVDAILSVCLDGGEQMWAADVCTVPVPDAMPAAVAELEQNVLAKLDAIAEASGQDFTFSLHPRLFADGLSSKERKNQLKTDADRILLAARSAVDSGQDYLPEANDELGIQILLNDDGELPEGTRVSFFPFVGGNDASIANQLTRDLAPKVSAKLRKQLKAPRAGGYPVVLVLDQRGHLGMPVPTNFLASAVGIRLVVEQTVAAEQATLDACVLVDPNNEVVELIGHIGTPLPGLAPQGD